MINKARRYAALADYIVFGNDDERYKGIVLIQLCMEAD